MRRQSGQHPGVSTDLGLPPLPLTATYADVMAYVRSVRHARARVQVDHLCAQEIDDQREATHDQLRDDLRSLSVEGWG